MPLPALGALDACIGGSALLGGVCESHVRQITDKAQAEAAKRRTEFADLVRRDTEVIWCAAADAPAAKDR
jgi:hypothetical protein